MNTTNQHKNFGSFPTSRKLLCATYAVISLVALFATWSQNIAYLPQSGRALMGFLTDSKVTPASRSLTVDILLLFLTASILMVLEARKHGVKFVWLYVIGGLAIAISVTFPLFLIARELRLNSTNRPSLSATNATLLGILGLLVVGLTIWVDVV